MNKKLKIHDGGTLGKTFEAKLEYPKPKVATMNNDMKCPICGTILDKAFINDKIRGCPKCRNMGNIELWQELIRTRKALDVAVDALKYLYDTNDDYVPGFAVPCGVKGYAKEKLEQITALEQKDVK